MTDAPVELQVVPRQWISEISLSTQSVLLFRGPTGQAELARAQRADRDRRAMTERTGSLPSLRINGLSPGEPRRSGRSPGVTVLPGYLPRSLCRDTDVRGQDVKSRSSSSTGTPTRSARGQRRCQAGRAFMYQARIVAMPPRPTRLRPSGYRPNLGWLACPSSFRNSPSLMVENDKGSSHESSCLP